MRAAVDHMRVDHRRPHIRMTKQLLDGPNVVTVLEQMRCKRMTKRMARRSLADPRAQDRLVDGLLDRRFVVVMAAQLAGRRVSVVPRRGEEPLPGPFAAGVGQFALEVVGKFDPAGASGEVRLMQLGHCVAVPQERFAKRLRQDGLPVLVPLAGPDRERVPGEVDVLDAEANGFEQAQARTVEQRRDEVRWAGQPGQDLRHFAAVEDDRQVLADRGTHEVVEPWRLDAEHFAVEEQERREGLVLGRGRAPFDRGEVREEGGDLGGAELAGVAESGVTDEATHPVHVGLFGARAVVAKAEGSGQLVEQARLAHAREVPRVAVRWQGIPSFTGRSREEGRSAFRRGSPPPRHERRRSLQPCR